MIALRDIVEEKGWKQAEAARVFKLTQPRVSDLLQGKIDKFSIDLLMTCLHTHIGKNRLRVMTCDVGNNFH